MSKTRPPAQRRYPSFWEKLIPIILGVIALAMLVLIFVAIGVSIGWIG